MRVKPGVVHDRYPDIPLGGWVGKIKRIGWLTPIAYAIHWTKPTLDQAHPVYFKRCQRDNLKPHRQWLEEDQLEAASNEIPTAMEQPTNILTPPLSMDEPEDRIRIALGLTGDDPLPKADERAQRKFLDYLKAHLSFPFKAQHYPMPPKRAGKVGEVTALGFADPPLDRDAGIVVLVGKAGKEIQVPLTTLHLSEKFQLPGH